TSWARSTPPSAPIAERKSRDIGNRRAACSSATTATPARMPPRTASGAQINHREGGSKDSTRRYPPRPTSDTKITRALVIAVLALLRRAWPSTLAFPPSITRCPPPERGLIERRGPFASKRTAPPIHGAEPCASPLACTTRSLVPSAHRRTATPRTHPLDCFR